MLALRRTCQFLDFWKEELNCIPDAKGREAESYRSFVSKISYN